MSNDIKQLAKRKLNFFQTIKAVIWGLFGVRKGKGHTKDTETLNPVYLIIAGVIAAVVFVISLVFLAGSLANYFSQ